MQAGNEQRRCQVAETRPSAWMTDGSWQKRGRVHAAKGTVGPPRAGGRAGTATNLQVTVDRHATGCPYGVSRERTRLHFCHDFPRRHALDGISAICGVSGLVPRRLPSPGVCGSPSGKVPCMALSRLQINRSGTHVLMRPRSKMTRNDATPTANEAARATATNAVMNSLRRGDRSQGERWAERDASERLECRASRANPR